MKTEVCSVGSKGAGELGSRFSPGPTTPALAVIKGKEKGG
jgi:hypothetical protein